MVTPNPEKQLELEIAAVTAEPVAPAEAPDEVLPNDLDEMADADDSPEPAPLEQPVVPAGQAPNLDAPALAPPMVPPAPPVNEATQQQLRQQQEQLDYYRQQQYQQDVAKAVQDYTRQLEDEGHMPEQAARMAAEARQAAERDMQTRQQHQQQLNFEKGRHKAAQHFAKQYNLGLEDLDRLRKYDNPQSMEEAAKDIKSRREDKAEIARLKAAQVPSQNFDNSQSSPAASNNEDRWLDRYNQGDRSEQAQAAARRAAGLG